MIRTEPMMEGVDFGGGGGEPADPIRDAITSSIADGGGIDHSEGPTPAPAAPKAATQTPEELAEEQEIAALEKEILGKNPQLKGNMPLHRHQAVLTRNRNQWTKAEADYKAKVQKYEKDMAEWKRYEWAKDPDLQGALQALQLAETDQKAFAEYIMQDPRFADLIEFKKPSQEVGDEPPGPNVPDGQGGFYYDQKGFDARMAWERAQAEKASLAKMEAKQKEFEARYKPVVEEHEARNQWQRTVSEQKGVLENARAKWDGFKEYEPKIRKALVDNPDWDLKDAYIMTVPKERQGAYTLSRDKLRQEIIDEMNGKKRAVTVVKPGQAPEREVGQSDDEIGDAIRRSIAASQR